MAALHSALKSLGPLSFSDFPQESATRDDFVQDLFAQSQLVLESVPPPPEDPTTPTFDPSSPFATKASEIRSSSARSAPAAPEYAALQKEWGKPLKLAAKENPLGMSVYKMSGKDGRGAWFARRSVHEGLGFSRWKRGLEREFPESMEIQGAPGVGNIRGIGGERRVENIAVANGKVEVYHLSAQFPGPTAPRDFVTFLVTSSSAMKEEQAEGLVERPLRHYMIISKPCDHPDTQPRNGFTRGSYESVEFIREVQRRPTRSQSSIDLNKLRSQSPPLDKSVMLRNAEKAKTLALSQSNSSADNLSHLVHSDSLSDDQHDRRRSTSRGRGATISFAESRGRSAKGEAFDNPKFGEDDPERNPVEWIMITRSDPGGSVPRFMVERGTPSSIVADASKFLDWACQKEHPDTTVDDEVELKQDDSNLQMENFESFQSNGHLAGISKDDPNVDTQLGGRFTGKAQVPTASNKSEKIPPSPGALPESIPPDSGIGAQSGWMTGVSSYLGSYAPHAISDYLTGSRTGSPLAHSQELLDNNDASSTISSTSFASADSHLNSLHDENTSIHSSSNFSPRKDGVDLTAGSSETNDPQSKELEKIAVRRKALDAKLMAAREKSAKESENQSLKEQEAFKRFEEKHDREVKRMEEKHFKEVEKLARKRSRDRKKEEERRKKQADKDEKARLTRERDEARAELELLRRQNQIQQQQVGDLQRENTRLAALLGKSEESLSHSENLAGNGTPAIGKDAIRTLIGEDKAQARLRGISLGSGGGNRSRSGSTRRSGDT